MYYLFKGMKIADLIEVIPTVKIIELWERKYESDCDVFQGSFSRATVSFEQSELKVAEVRIKSSDRICVYFEKKNKAGHNQRKQVEVGL